MRGRLVVRERRGGYRSGLAPVPVDSLAVGLEKGVAVRAAIAIPESVSQSQYLTRAEVVDSLGWV